MRTRTLASYRERAAGYGIDASYVTDEELQKLVDYWMFPTANDNKVMEGVLNDLTERKKRC